MVDNATGQLGIGNYSNTNRPVQIIAGGIAGLAVGSLWGMGVNGVGQLGDGTTNSSNLPELIVAAPRANQMTGMLQNDGVMSLTFTGLGGTNYALDGCFNLTSAKWQALATNAANANGAVLFTNTPNATTNNYWRVRAVP